MVLQIRNRPEEDFPTKTGEARDLQVPDGLWAEMCAVRGDEREFFIPGASPTERQKVVERDINKILRPILVGYKDGAYTLRKWAGSMVYTRFGGEAARKFLGHANLKTTEGHYADFLSPVSAVAVPDLDAVYGAAARVA
jgi:integrase